MLKTGGLGMIVATMSVLLFLLNTIVQTGFTAFLQNEITLSLPQKQGIKPSMEAILRDSFPQLNTLEEARAASYLISWGLLV